MFKSCKGLLTICSLNIIVLFLKYISRHSISHVNLNCSHSYLKDVLTDLKAESEPIPVDPVRDDWLAHKVCTLHTMHVYIDTGFVKWIYKIDLAVIESLQSRKATSSSIICLYRDKMLRPLNPPSKIYMCAATYFFYEKKRIREDNLISIHDLHVYEVKPSNNYMFIFLIL